MNGHSGPQDTTIPKLPLNTDPIESNAWLAGFIEGEGCFQVRASPRSVGPYLFPLSLLLSNIFISNTLNRRRVCMYYLIKYKRLRERGASGA